MTYQSDATCDICNKEKEHTVQVLPSGMTDYPVNICEDCLRKMQLLIEEQAQ